MVQRLISNMSSGRSTATWRSVILNSLAHFNCANCDLAFCSMLLIWFSRARIFCFCVWICRSCETRVFRSLWIFLASPLLTDWVTPLHIGLMFLLRLAAVLFSALILIRSGSAPERIARILFWEALRLDLAAASACSLFLISAFAIYTAILTVSAWAFNMELSCLFLSLPADLIC